MFDDDDVDDMDEVTVSFPGLEADEDEDDNEPDDDEFDDDNDFDDRDHDDIDDDEGIELQLSPFARRAMKEQ